MPFLAPGPTLEVPFEAVAFPPEGPATSGNEGPDVPMATEIEIMRQQCQALCTGLDSLSLACDALAVFFTVHCWQPCRLVS